MWDVLARLGRTGDRDRIAQAVFERASEVMELSEIFDGIGATRDWPARGTCAVAV